MRGVMAVRITIRAKDPNRYNQKNAGQIWQDIEKLQSAISRWQPLAQTPRPVSIKCEINYEFPGIFTITINEMNPDNSDMIYIPINNIMLAIELSQSYYILKLK
jgi:hypothetical protein